MHANPADALSPPLTWLLVALSPLMAADGTFNGNVALAVAVPCVVAAGALAARQARSRLTGPATLVLATILAGLLVATTTDALGALWPALGDAPARFLPLALVGALYAADASGLDASSRTLRPALVAGLVFAVALTFFAGARELAARLPLLVLTPPGAFVVTGVAVALWRVAGRGRSSAAIAAGPTA